MSITEYGRNRATLRYMLMDSGRGHNYMKMGGRIWIRAARALFMTKTAPPTCHNRLSGWLAGQFVISDRRRYISPTDINTRALPGAPHHFHNTFNNQSWSYDDEVGACSFTVGRCASVPCYDISSVSDRPSVRNMTAYGTTIASEWHRITGERRTVFGEWRNVTHSTGLTCEFFEAGKIKGWGVYFKMSLFLITQLFKLFLQQHWYTESVLIKPFIILYVHEVGMHTQFVRMGFIRRPYTS